MSLSSLLDHKVQSFRTWNKMKHITIYDSEMLGHDSATVWYRDSQGVDLYKRIFHWWCPNWKGTRAYYAFLIWEDCLRPLLANDSAQEPSASDSDANMALGGPSCVNNGYWPCPGHWGCCGQLAWSNALVGIAVLTPGTSMWSDSSVIGVIALFLYLPLSNLLLCYSIGCHPPQSWKITLIS